jgi:hypothetical protein
LVLFFCPSAWLLFVILFSTILSHILYLWHYNQYWIAYSRKQKINLC